MGIVAGIALLPDDACCQELVKPNPALFVIFVNKIEVTAIELSNSKHRNCNIPLYYPEQ